MRHTYQLLPKFSKAGPSARQKRKADPSARRLCIVPEQAGGAFEHMQPPGALAPVQIYTMYSEMCTIILMVRQMLRHPSKLGARVLELQKKSEW